MSVLKWLRSFWRLGDFSVVGNPVDNCTTPVYNRVTTETVGRITQLNGANEQKHSINCKDSAPVQPIAERIKALKAKAARKRQVPSGATKPPRLRQRTRGR